LEDYVRKVGGEDLWKSLRKIYGDIASGRVVLEDPYPPKTFAEYVLRLEYTLWFWTAVSIAILTIAIIYLSSYIPTLNPLRYFLGTLYTLFLPGYVLVEALYPEEKELKPLERVALSIGLSLAVVPLIGLILNYTPWGIRLNPVVVSLALYTLSIAIIALVRKYNIYKLSITIKRGRTGRR
jgi:uncharacterized membrane protein